MLNFKLVLRSALIALLLLTLAAAYPALSTGGLFGGVVFAQEVNPEDEEPEPQPDEPAFNFVKLVNDQDANTVEQSVVVEPGTPLAFRFEVQNTGNVTLTWESLTDTVLGDLSAQCELPRQVIVGAVEACVVNSTAGEAPDGSVNIATATVLGLTPQTDEAWYRTPEQAEPEPPEEPAFTFVKLVNGQDANSLDQALQVPAGAPLTFRFQVQNTGNVPLTWESLTDTVLGNLTAQCALPRVVAVGATEACDINSTASSATGGSVNVATATVLGLAPQVDEAWYRTPVIPATPDPTSTPPVPIPEPITIVLFGTGLAALSAAAAARRRQE